MIERMRRANSATPGGAIAFQRVARGGLHAGREECSRWEVAPVKAITYSNCRIAWKVRYSDPPRKGTLPANIWKTIQPNAHKSELCQNQNAHKSVSQCQPAKIRHAHTRPRSTVLEDGLTSVQPIQAANSRHHLFYGEMFARSLPTLSACITSNSCSGGTGSIPVRLAEQSHHICPVSFVLC